MNKSNIFQRISRKLFEKRDQTSDLLNPKQWLLNALGIRKSLTGINVTEASAMNYSAVYACIRIIAETIASLPLNVYRRLDKGKEKATDHPLYRPLHLKPNADMTSFSWREAMGVHLNTNGNSYNYKLRNEYKSVVGFYPLLPERMIVETKLNEIIYKYTFTDNIQRVVPREDILHIPGLSFNGIIGKSPITMAREAIGLGLALEEFGARFFSQGTNIGGIAQHPGKLSDKSFDNLKEQLNEAYQGLGNVHKLMILEDGMTFNQITIPPNDAQFIESRRFQVEEIARMFRVPKHLLQDLINATFSNIEHQSIDFVVHTIRPWLVRIEQSLNSDPELFDDEYFCEFVVDGLLRGDVATRFQSYTQAIQNGIYCPNDILEMENKNPYDGGQFHFVQLNMQTVEDVGKLINGSREIVINGTEIRVIPKEIKAIENVEDRDLNPKLAERLGKAYKPLFVNALIRILKREKVDVLKIEKNKSTSDNVKKYYEKHKEFVNKQIKPVIYAFSEALGAETELKEMDITIYANEYSQDFVERYIENNLQELSATEIEQWESLFNEWLENKPEELSTAEILRIQTAFNKYIEKIGGNGTG